MLKKISFPIFYIVILILMTFALIVLLELSVSFIIKKPRDYIYRNFRLNHTWPPNRKAIHRELTVSNPQYKPYIHVYNAQGWIENYDVKITKPKNTYRIFYVGDSFTEGTVPMEQSVPSIVERWLNESFVNSGINFEVINTGTTSYSPIIYYILIRYFISKYSPDLIVINVDMTDDFDDWKYSQNMILDSQGKPWAVPMRDIYRLAYIDTKFGQIKMTLRNKLQLFLFENSYLYNLFLKMREKLIMNNNIHAQQSLEECPDVYKRWSWCSQVWDKETERQVRFTMYVLQEIAIYCKDNNIKLLLTGVPHYRQVIFQKDGQRAWSIRPHQELEKVALKNNVAYLDSVKFMQEYIKRTKQTDFYYNDDMHLNPKGYATWAQAHIEALADPKKELLPDSAYNN